MQRARTGDVASQIAIGEAYLRGTDGTSKNEQSALFWLSRAAASGDVSARQVIGKEIDLTTARRSACADLVLSCYAEAGGLGNRNARWRYAEWALAADAPPLIDRELALRWLRELASDGHTQATWLLLLHLRSTPAARRPEDDLTKLAESAARASILNQQAAQQSTARERRSKQRFSALNSAGETSDVLIRQVDALATATMDGEASQVAFQLLEKAAAAGHPEGQYRLGCAYGQLGNDKPPLSPRTSPGAPKHRLAVYWLSLAAEQGHAGASYALAHVFRNRNFSGYSVDASDAALAKAARLGHPLAQYEFGRLLLRRRARSLDHRIEGSYWLWKSHLNGHHEARELLGRLVEIASPARQRLWDAAAGYTQRVELQGLDRMMGMRIRLAQAFGLDSSELLLLEVPGAIREHCLVVNIQSSLVNRRIRLVLVETALQKKVLKEAESILMANSAAILEEDLHARRKRLASILALANGAPIDRREISQMPHIAQQPPILSVEHSSSLALA